MVKEIKFYNLKKSSGYVTFCIKMYDISGKEIDPGNYIDYKNTDKATVECNDYYSSNYYPVNVFAKWATIYGGWLSSYTNNNYIHIIFKEPLDVYRIDICGTPGTWANNRDLKSCDIDIVYDIGFRVTRNFVRENPINNRNIYQPVEIGDKFDLKTNYKDFDLVYTDDNNNFKDINIIKSLNISTNEPQDTFIKILVSNDSHNTYYRFENNEWIVTRKSDIINLGNTSSEINNISKENLSKLINENKNSIDFCFYLQTNNKEITPSVNRIQAFYL